MGRWRARDWVIGFFVVSVLASGRSALTDTLDKAPDRPTSIVLRGGAFDPVRDRTYGHKLAMPDWANARYGLVQFVSVDYLHADRLRAIGVEVVDYLPHNAYIVRWTDAAKQALSATAGVRYADAFQPRYKISPALWGDAKNAIDTLEVFGFRGESITAIAVLLKKLAPRAQVLSADAPADVPVLRLRLRGHDAVTVARQAALADGVMWVDRFYPRRRTNVDSVGPIQANEVSGGPPPDATPIWDQDIIGTGQIIAVADSGLDRNSTFFSRWDTGAGPPEVKITDAQTLAADELGDLYLDRKVVGYFVQPGATAYDNDNECDGSFNRFHGTHVTGTAAADGGIPATSTEPNYGDGDGMAPHAQILFQDLGDDASGCLVGRGGYPMFTQAARAGAYISSNSYGGSPDDATVNGYFGNDFEADAAAYDLQDMLLIFSAGNSGSVANAVSHPGQAKAPLSVAATGHGNRANIAAFSSRGPAHDGRIKPEISAPGTSVRSVAGNDNNDNPAAPEIPLLRSASGTSMATPTVAGAAALLRQYYMDGFYPAGVRAINDRLKPTGALMKATLLNGTRLYADTPSNASGWGRIWLDNNLYFAGDDRQLRVWDLPNSVGLKSGESHQFTMRVAANEPFRATLVWFDPPANVVAGIALVNDLDLEVSANGDTWWGNRVINGESRTGGSQDRLNTVEQVILGQPLDGEYTVRVNAVAVPGNGAPNTDSQGYALVVSSAQCDSAVGASSALRLAPAEAGIAMSFGAIAGAREYQVYRALGNCATDVTEFRFLGSTATLAFEDRHTQGGFEYAYRLRGVDACGEGPISDCQSTLSTAACTLAPRFDVSTVTVETLGDTCGARVAWSAGTVQCPGTDLAYNVYRSTDPFFATDEGTLIAGGVQGTEWIDTAVEPLSTYYYAVRAQDTAAAGGGNLSTQLLRRRVTTRGATSSPGDYFDDPDAVSFAALASPWQVSESRASLGRLSYHNATDGGQYPNLTCAHLTTPALTLQSGSPSLSYDAWYNLEVNWDGVVVEISNDGGASWRDLPPDGGYPSDFSMTAPEGVPINECGYAPSHGAFNGVQESFQNYRSDLSAYAGQEIMLRWTFSSDPGLEFEGFYLDNIAVTDASTPDACAVFERDISGPWFNAQQSGHGWLIELLASASGPDLVNAYWYVYRDGDPAWLIGTGPLQGNRATMSAFIADGADFPPNFDPNDVQLTPWGELTFTFEGDATGTLAWASLLSEFGSGELPMAQLAPIASRPEACRSGSYYDPNQDGHGFAVQVVEVAGELQAIVAWYVYQQGRQIWLFGQGPLQGDVAVVPMGQFSGGDFPPNFVPSAVINQPWGSLRMTFTGSDSAQVSWQADQPGFTDGSLTLTRLTGLKGHACP